MTRLWKKDPVTGAKLPRPVARLAETDRGELVVVLTPEGVMVREKGRRTWYGPLPYGWLLVQAADRVAQARRAAKRGGRGRRVKRGLL